MDSFEKCSDSTILGPESKDIDVEKNLVKHILESHGCALSQNQNSPFNMMISQLGLNIPDPGNT